MVWTVAPVALFDASLTHSPRCSVLRVAGLFVRLEVRYPARMKLPLPLKITERNRAFMIRDNAGNLVAWFNYGVDPSQASVAKLQDRETALEIARFIARALTDRVER